MIGDLFKESEILKDLSTAWDVFLGIVLISGSIFAVVCLVNVLLGPPRKDK